MIVGCYGYLAAIGLGLSRIGDKVHDRFSNMQRRPRKIEQIRIKIGLNGDLWMMRDEFLMLG